MSIKRVAVIFDNRSRPETTGVYCRRALGQLVEVEHFLPTEISRLPRTGFDLYLNIDDGYRYRLPADLGPTAWWAIDTHMDLEWYLTKGPDFDQVFVAQRDGAAALQQAGINACWLPLACDPGIHAQHPVEQRYDVGFVGSITPDRQAWLEVVRQHFPNTFVGRCYFDEMARTYSASRVVFNRSVRNDVNMRVFEALGCGAFLLTNHIEGNGLEELFEVGRELTTYRTPEELIDRIHHFLQHPNEREEIARAGRAAVLNRHTYVHRMQSILHACSQSAGHTGSQASIGTKLQDRHYYEFDRPEVVALVPAEATQILDVGCGAGRLGAALKGRQPCHVTGLELDPEAAAVARDRLDHVLNANIESEDTNFPEGSFDCVICADVLEHLREPEQALEKIRRWLRPAGCLVTSVPNVRHHTVVTSLIEGNWTYEPAGLLDNTHLRFFTRREIEKLLFRSGFDAGEWQFVPGASYEEWARQADRSEVRVGKLRMAGLDPADAEEFHTYQYLIRARSAARPQFELTSIILVTHNQVELTKACLESVRRFTDEPIEILVVDNGSTDGTVEFLRTQSDVRLIANTDNRGFGAAANQGIAAAQGGHFVLLNNDVVVTTGWLRRMLEALHRDPQIGMVGPCTNCTSGLQRIASPQYDVRNLDDFAWRWAKQHAGHILPVPELTGFCLLIRRSVVNQIGTFDERFGVHCFEDVDFCRRAVGAGFQAVIARDAYVHHHGHRSYSGAGLDQDELAKEGERLYRAKWQLPRDESPDLPPKNGQPEADFTLRSTLTPDWLEIAARLVPKCGSDVLVIGERAAAVKGGLDRPSVQQTTWDELASLDAEFDCIIACGLADTPHLDRSLTSLRQRLRPEGVLIADFPNTRHHAVVSGLLDGAWCCAPVSKSSCGDPIRFVTRREIERLLDRSGFELDTLEIIPGDGHSEWVRGSTKDRVDLGRLRIAGLTPEQAEEFFAGGYATCSRPRRAKSYGLTSIILVTHNEVQYTRRCLDSIIWRTDEPYEVIVVDNGSMDSTVPYLRSLSGLTLIENAENRGFPAAVNQGLKVARGDQVLLLNNDTVVTTGWLRRMLDVLTLDPRIGLVGPCSNRISGEQQVPVDYDSMTDLDGFAWDWAKEHRREMFETDRLVGFCLLIRRSVVDQIGGMDERFGIGCFEDDDFCRRALAAGFRAVIARDAFVHHFGSRTFVGNGVDLGRVLDENREKYDAKWNAESRPEPQPQVTPWSLTISDEGGLQLNPRRARLSLCMIVRDNEGTIRPCLESIRPWVDEMIVVDTGSRDATPQIARELGARIHEFPWCDDFSAARNESLRYATGEWIFWMDSDDTITAECGRRLRELALGSHPENVLGYVIQVHCPAPGEYGSEDVTAVDHVKLIRNFAPLQFEGRIHEQIIPAIRRLGGDVAWTDLYVTHSGADHSPETRARKLERDFRLLRLELQEKPDHPFVLFNLGMTYVDAEQFDDAIRYLKRYLEVAEPVESTFRKGYALLVAALSRMDDFATAWEICEKGLEFFPDDKELLFRSGVILHQLGRLPEAERAYIRVLSESTERHFASIDLAISGYKARHNLALVYEDARNWEQAEIQWRQITSEAPGYAPGWSGLGRVLLKLGRLQESHALALRLQSEPQLRVTGAILAAHHQEAMGQVEQAELILSGAERTSPENPELLRELARLRFELGSPAAAVLLLERLTHLTPEEPAAQHNLAVAYLHAGRPCDAVTAAERSVQLRPESDGTWKILVQALQDSGRCSEAQAALQRARHETRRLPRHNFISSSMPQEGRTCLI